MDLLFYRYRHLTVLLVVIVAQLGLLAFQVRNDKDVRLIRVWAVTAVTPVARVLESVRGGSSTFIDDYLLLLDVRQENKRLKTSLDKAQLDVQRMKTDLETADRAHDLAVFQKNSQQKTVGAQVIMSTPGNSGVISSVFIDVGTPQGIQPGMAVITPGGIVGKVTASYPTGSMVLLMNDPRFAAGVISEKNHVQGTLKGQGNALPIVDFIQNEQTVEQGEMFYTSGNDFIFPRGRPVGTAVVVKNGLRRKEIQIKPSGFDPGVGQVLVIVSGVHSPIPDAPPPAVPITLQTPPPDAATPQAAIEVGPVATEADRMMQAIRAKQPPVPGKAAPAAPAAQPQTAPQQGR
jgi:rod shape-determining protein MreC